uniref:Uncharacterized protein n=1 Tax=Trichogramma kaykai TaxID=54128 RepID=A0ABD2XP32_9HYME
MSFKRARQFRHAHCCCCCCSDRSCSSTDTFYNKLSIMHREVIPQLSPQGSGTIRVESNSLELETFGNIVANRDREFGRGYTHVSLSHRCTLDHVNDSAIVSGRSEVHVPGKPCDPIRSFGIIYLCFIVHKYTQTRGREKAAARFLNNFTRARSGAPFFTTGNCRRHRHSRTLTQLLIRFNHCTIRINIYNKTRSLYSISVQLFKND